jgi:hypothetical protein
LIDYKNNKLFAQVKCDCLQQLFNLVESTRQQDMLGGYDLVFDVKIAVRLRQQKYFGYQDFTVREISTWAQAPSELSKILKGWVDFYYYGWKNLQETGVEYYMILDMFMFRLALLTEPPRVPKVNPDGTAFLHFPLTWLLQNNVCIFKNF